MCEYACSCELPLFDKELLSEFGHALKTLSAAGERELHTEDQSSFLFLTTPLTSFPSVALCVFINPSTIVPPLLLIFAVCFFFSQCLPMEIREFWDLNWFALIDSLPQNNSDSYGTKWRKVGLKGGRTGLMGEMLFKVRVLKHFSLCYNCSVLVLWLLLHSTRQWKKLATRCWL